MVTMVISRYFLPFIPLIQKIATSVPAWISFFEGRKLDEGGSSEIRGDRRFQIRRPTFALPLICSTAATPIASSSITKPTLSHVPPHLAAGAFLLNQDHFERVGGNEFLPSRLVVLGH